VYECSETREVEEEKSPKARNNYGELDMNKT